MSALYPRVKAEKQIPREETDFPFIAAQDHHSASKNVKTSLETEPFSKIIQNTSVFASNSVNPSSSSDNNGNLEIARLKALVPKTSESFVNLSPNNVNAIISNNNLLSSKKRQTPRSSSSKPFNDSYVYPKPKSSSTPRNLPVFPDKPSSLAIRSKDPPAPLRDLHKLKFSKPLYKLDTPASLKSSSSLNSHLFPFFSPRPISRSPPSTSLHKSISILSFPLTNDEIISFWEIYFLMTGTLRK